MWHRNRLTDAIEIRAGEASRTIAPGQRVDLAAEILPGVALAEVVRIEWFEPETAPDAGASSGRLVGASVTATTRGYTRPTSDIVAVAPAPVEPEPDPEK